VITSIPSIPLALPWFKVQLELPRFGMVDLGRRALSQRSGRFPQPQFIRKKIRRLSVRFDQVYHLQGISRIRPSGYKYLVTNLKI
jgi:hypothetical protein